MEKPPSYRTHPDVIPFPVERTTTLDGETTPYLSSNTSAANPPSGSVVRLAAHRQPLKRHTTRDSGDGHRDCP